MLAKFIFNRATKRIDNLSPINRIEPTLGVDKSKSYSLNTPESVANYLEAIIKRENQENLKFLSTPEMAAAEYQIIGEHLLEIMRTAQNERRNIAVIRGTTFFAMLGIPAFVFTQAPDLIPQLSPALEFAKNVGLAGSFIYLMRESTNLNTEFEHYMGLQTNVSKRAEKLLDEYQQGRVSGSDIFKNVDYDTLRKEQKPKIDEQVEKGEFIYDFPTKAARRILLMSTGFALSILILKGTINKDEIKTDVARIADVILNWIEEKSFENQQKSSPLLPPQPQYLD